MDNNNASIDKPAIETQYIISVGKFAFLSVITFGLYNLWWTYKEWRFFQEKENQDLAPAIRAIFGVVFLIPLFTRIKNFAKHSGYPKTFSPVALYLCYLLAAILTYLPIPLSIIGVLSCLILLPPVKALNYAKLQNPIYNAVVQDSFNGRQICLIVFGSIFWLGVLLSVYIMLTTANPYDYKTY